MKRVRSFFIVGFAFLPGALWPSIGHAQLCQNISEPTPTGNETVFAHLGGVQLIQRELSPPCEGFEASIIEARATTPGSIMGTFTNLSITNTHQLWSSVGLEQSVFGPTPPSVLFDQDWQHLDSHLLITKDMILAGVYSMSETNDGSTSSSISLPPTLNGASTPRGGYGTLAMGNETDAFALQRDLWGESLDLAYVVSKSDAPAPTKLTVGVLGNGIATDGSRFGKALEFGYNGNPEISFLPFVPVDPTVEPPAPLPTAIGTITSPTTYSEVYEGPGGFHRFHVPIEVAPAPDGDHSYSVRLTGVEASGDLLDLGNVLEPGFFEQGGFLAESAEALGELITDSPFHFAAGTTGSLPITFLGNEVGTSDANFKFTFNDGTVVDAMLTANITENITSGGLEPRPTTPTVDCSGFERQPLPENGVLFAEQGCVELISIPVEVGNGLMATKLVARGVDPDAKLITLANVKISNAHQVWAGGGIQAPGGTAVGKPESSATYHEDWIALDSHLLISKDMIGGGVGEVTETNSGASQLGESLPDVLGVKPTTGAGTISMSDETDAFFLVPEHQANMLDIAYIVSDGSEPIELTLGILGTGIRNAGTENGAAFGYAGNSQMAIPMSSQAVPEPSGGSLILLAGALGFSLRRRWN